MSEKIMEKELEIFIPVALDLDWPTADGVIECIKEQNEKYGFKNFISCSLSIFAASNSG